MIVKFGHTTSSYVNDVFLQKYAINKTGMSPGLEQWWLHKEALSF